MDDFFDFGDPFGPGSLMSIFLGGKDPFDDLFLTQPFGSLMGRTLGDDDGYEEKDGEEHEENTRKHSRPHKELVIQEADGIIEENKSRSIRYTNNFNHSHTMQSLSNTFTFQSSTMTYGDPNGVHISLHP